MHPHSHTLPHTYTQKRTKAKLTVAATQLLLPGEPRLGCVLYTTQTPEPCVENFLRAGPEPAGGLRLPKPKLYNNFDHAAK